jgi:hypothetical protein
VAPCLPTVLTFCPTSVDCQGDNLSIMNINK